MEDVHSVCDWCRLIFGYRDHCVKMSQHPMRKCPHTNKLTSEQIDELIREFLSYAHNSQYEHRFLYGVPHLFACLSEQHM